MYAKAFCMLRHRRIWRHTSTRRENNDDDNVRFGKKQLVRRERNPRVEKRVLVSHGTKSASKQLECAAQRFADQRKMCRNDEQNEILVMDRVRLQ